MSSKPILLQFAFDNFEALPLQEDDFFTISEAKEDGVGHSWRLVMCPGEDTEGDPLLPADMHRSVSVDLYMSAGSNNVDAIASYTMRNANGGIHKHSQLKKGQYVKGVGAGGRVTPMEKRSAILEKENNILSDGALVIDVEIQIIGKKRKYQPSNPAIMNLQNMLRSGDHADVKFKLGRRVIPAHKLILLANAPILAEFCGNKRTPVLIRDTSLEIFRIILQYIYGGDAPGEDVILSKGKKIIEAANRYEIVGLKMAVENSLVGQRAVHLENAADWLVFADANTCPLLKEHALTYVASRAKDVLAHESSANLKESPKLMEELVLAMSKDQSNGRFPRDDEMYVDDMRAKLAARGRDVDGSKETLASRLASDGDEE